MPSTMPQPPEPGSRRSDAEQRLLITSQTRATSRLRQPDIPASLPLPSIADLETTLLRAAPRGVWLFGGEPTLRVDLPEVVRAVRERTRRPVGLRTDALVFGDERALEQLMEAGLGRARVVLHSVRADAHDWLSGIRGSAARAVRAATVLTRAGIEVELETLVTRINAPYIGEIVELAARLGIGACHFDRLTLTKALADDAVALSPRVGLVQAYCEGSADLARVHGVRAVFHGFPPCALGQAATAVAPSPLWLVPPRWPEAVVVDRAKHPTVRCQQCPASCGGAPADYVEQFGAVEFASEWLPRPDSSSEQYESVSVDNRAVMPPPRSSQGPATRLRALREQQTVVGVTGDSRLRRTGVVETTLRVRWQGESRLESLHRDEPVVATPESTRQIRKRLVQAAQYGADVLRIVGDGILTHPALAELLEELPRLNARKLELCAEGSAVADIPTAALDAFGIFERVDFPLFAAGASSHDTAAPVPSRLDKTLEAAERLRGTLRSRVNVFAVLSDRKTFEDFAVAWSRGLLPGTPMFRLSRRGDSLDALADAAAIIDDERARLAICSLLPSCLVTTRLPTPTPLVLGREFTYRPEERAPSSCDRIGSFRPCACGPLRAATCPGIAVGWVSLRIGAVSP